MLQIPGYRLEEVLSESSHTIIYRARQVDEQPVILKVLQAHQPTLEEMARLKQEYKIAANLKIEGVIKAYSLETFKNVTALVLEDFGGLALSQFIHANRLTLTRFLNIAIQLADTLEQLHQHQIIHKDIKPQNIIINPETEQVKITDFSIASQLVREIQQVNNPEILEGTLAYMSPEQTGRMNRTISFKSDLYSLGVTFYEMLTLRLPFESQDPLELVHCHIAKLPIPPHHHDSTIPEPISLMVMKLLAKNAEDRYQSASGLKADLQICLDQLQTKGEIDSFLLGQIDLSDQLFIPQKLYGREQEVEMLLQAFERVAGGEGENNIELMLVSGYSGIGKSSLVNEIHKPIVQRRGYFIGGKFDQFKRDIPYASLIQAFQELMQQLLTEQSEKLQSWKQKLLAALGSNGQIIIDAIAEVELIIGPQPAVVQLGPTESQNRFNRVFQAFIQVFAQASHPLVLFLDDLQWADAASLQMIQQLMTNAESQYLLLIGAYRDNEVNATHPLIQTLDDIQKTTVKVSTITLRPLALSHVEQFLGDTLIGTQKTQTQLATLLFNKTAGNPFFLTQMLKALYQEKLLCFNFADKKWLWDIAEIQALGITDLTVVELVASNIRSLPDTTQEVLKLAACIGNRFNLDILATISQKTLSQTASGLWSALQSGLILPLNKDYKIPLLFGDRELEGMNFDDSRLSYKFLHDRVQQAAYSLIPANQKQETHLKIGELLLNSTPPEALESNIFDIVNQLNVGIQSLTERAEQDKLANLNLIAGKRATEAAAYEPAIRYLQTGLGLLTENSWLVQYDITLALFVEAAQAEYLNLNFAGSKKLVDTTLQKATKLLDKIKVYEIQIQSYASQNKLTDALNTGLEALKLLGIILPSHPTQVNVLLGLAQTKLTQGRRKIVDLINLPQMSDPNKLASLRILAAITVPAYIAQPLLLPLVTFAMVRLSIRFGNSALSAIGYGFYALLQCVLGDINGGYQFGQLALQLLEKFNAWELKSKVYLIHNNVIRHWKEHSKETLKPLLEGVASGIEMGDIESAGYCCGIYCVNLFFSGEALDDAEQLMGKYVAVTKLLKHELAIATTKMLKQAVLNLSDDTLQDKSRLIGESFNEAESVPILIEAKTFTVLGYTYLIKSILAYLFGEYAQALENINVFSQYEEAIPGTIAFTNSRFYLALILLACADANPAQKRQYLKQVETIQKQLQKWAFHAPMNYQHKFHLVAAEKARVFGRVAKAMEYYDLAIAESAKNGYIQEEALAYELAGLFYQSLGKEIVSQAYLTKAHNCYIRWGAVAKVRDLEAKFPYLLRISSIDLTIDAKQTAIATIRSNSDTLDMSAVMKACQAIASEIVLDKLLHKLMSVVLENAAAQKGLLILKKEDRLWIEAQAYGEEISVLQSLAVENSQDLPNSIINYVARTQEALVLNDATDTNTFSADPYILNNQPKSILCSPILHQGQLIGLLYLENNLTPGAFSRKRLEALIPISTQAAISICNASLFEQSVADGQKLEQAMMQLQQTQMQLIQNEKMSALGQLVAGIAHEINNPVNFIYGNLSHANDYVLDLLKLLQLYENSTTKASPELQEMAKNVDLEFLKEDLPKILNSMEMGTARIRGIVKSLRNFSRLDESPVKEVDIHEGIESTLMILGSRLQPSGRGAIAVVKEYGNLPLIQCYAGALNQVFMNILANAIDALEESVISHQSLVNSGVITLVKPRITIKTQVTSERVVIRIADNGPGIPEEVQKRLFDPFFTTKPIGKGTGLGLSISYQIVTQKHHGSLRCFSGPEKGTEFVVEIPFFNAESAEGALRGAEGSNN